MHKYKVITLDDHSDWGFFSPYRNYTFTSNLPLADFKKNLLENGFAASALHWIMPAAILSITIEKP
jgi:hypothetical protein